MHILLALISLITFLAVWYWRIKMISGAARGGYEAAKTVANLPRKHGFRNKARKAGLRAVTDPREAAAIMMLKSPGHAARSATRRKPPSAPR